MNKIDSYHFGQVIVSGKRYSSDLIIFPDRVQDAWHRSSSHQLSLKDIAEVMVENPEVVIVGTGAAGLVKVLPEVRQAAEARGIKLIAEPTGEACNTYNSLSHSQKTVAALHLTC